MLHVLILHCFCDLVNCPENLPALGRIFPVINRGLTQAEKNGDYYVRKKSKLHILDLVSCGAAVLLLYERMLGRVIGKAGDTA